MTFTEPQIEALLEPYLPIHTPTPPSLYPRLAAYLDLLLHWNARTNLTAIRDPQEIVRRHFGESLFAGAQLAAILPQASTLLDFGSGAGFPGLPIKLLLPHLQVTLAESQGKKAAFLREAIRTLELSTEVWAARVESMPADRRFDIVTLRAVDNMESAIQAAQGRCTPEGKLFALAGQNFPAPLSPPQTIPMPDTRDTYLYIL